MQSSLCVCVCVCEKLVYARSSTRLVVATASSSNDDFATITQLFCLQIFFDLVRQINKRTPDPRRKANSKKAKCELL